MRALEKMGFEEATPIQAETIPLAMKGLDVIGQAQTGTGKTAAFGIPMIEKIDSKQRKIQGMVVTPTRELAIQVAEEINRLGKIKGVRTLPVYGGQHMDRQIRSLKGGPQIVVATPGRLLDHMRRRTIRTNDIQTVVLDEADEMLNMGFIDDIKNILKGIPEERQTLLFSATMPKEIRDIATNLMKKTKEKQVENRQRRTIRTNDIQNVVPDETDEMLNMGFIDDIKNILKGIPEERQTLLFSATMPKEIRDIATNLMKKPEEIKVKAKEMTVENIDQYFIEIPDRDKFDTLTNHMDINDPELAIVFSRTKKRVDEITEGLQARGFRAEGIHGDLTQGKRMSVLNKFKNGRVEVLVATDVAARGLDISGVTHVYNFDIPQDPESYVHRIGRTGRAGRTGEAISFITPREMAHLKLIERTTKSKMKRMTPPTHQEAKQGQQQAAADKILETMEQKDLKSYHQTANELL